MPARAQAGDQAGRPDVRGFYFFAATFFFFSGFFGSSAARIAAAAVFTLTRTGSRFSRA